MTNFFPSLSLLTTKIPLKRNLRKLKKKSQLAEISKLKILPRKNQKRKPEEDTDQKKKEDTGLEKEEVPPRERN